MVKQLGFDFTIEKSDLERYPDLAIYYAIKLVRS
jgi:hypothetical protein